MPGNSDLWETRCFGGPLHGQNTDTRERDVSFQASIRAEPRVARYERELQSLNHALSVMTCHYEIVENQFADGGTRRRIRCAIAEGISRNHLIEYRDYLHAELLRFREENYQFSQGRDY